MEPHGRMLTPRDDDSPACPRCQDFIVQRDAAIADRDRWRHVAIEAMERPDGE